MFSRIEGAAHQLHGGQVGLGEHVAERLLLFLAHAVLAGNGAAVIDAEMQDAIGEIERDLLLAGNGAVVEHQRMQVAVAGMEDVGHAQVRPPRPGARSRASRCGSAVRGMTPSCTM